MALELIEAGRSFPLAIREGLVGYWHMDEAAWTGLAEEVIDSSGLGNHGTAKNGLTTIAGGKLGRAADMDAASEHYIDCGSPASLTSELETFTIAAWVKGPFGDNQPMVGFRSISAYPGIFIDSTLDRSMIYLGSGNFRRFRFSPVNINDGNWHLLIFTVPGGAQADIDSAKMYADNIEQSVFHTFSTSAQTPKTDFHIGHAGALYLNETMDELAVWTRVLSSGERTLIYNSGQALSIPVSGLNLPLEVADINPELEVVEV